MPETVLVVLYTLSKPIFTYEVNIIIYVLKLKKWSLRMSKSHTLSQLWNRDSDPVLCDSDGHAANHQISLPRWQILYWAESYGLLLSEVPYGAQRQRFLCGCWLITAIRYSLKFLLFPQERCSKVSNRDHLCACRCYLPFPLPKTPSLMPYW